MSRKVFDLECASGHVFEGWFASHLDFDAQLARGLLTCPVCDDGHIVKRVSAPHLNVSGVRDSTRCGVPTTGEAAQVAQLQASLLRQVRTLINSAENVGPRFAQEARRIAADGTPRAIRGTATAQERAELADDGIDFVNVPDIFDDERLQ